MVAIALLDYMVGKTTRATFIPSFAEIVAILSQSEKPIGVQHRLYLKL